MTSAKFISIGSLGGLLLIASFATTTALLKHQSWQEAQQSKAQLKANAALEQAKAEQARAIAEAYQQNQVAEVHSLIINDYTLSDTPPVLDWQHTVDPNRKTMIYDRYRRCIGYALNGEFHFIQTNNQACEVQP